MMLIGDVIGQKIIVRDIFAGIARKRLLMLWWGNIKMIIIFRKLLCGIGWHSPLKEKMAFDGFQRYSICKYCKAYIIQDSQGGWF